MTSITKVGTPTEAVGVVLCVPTSDESWAKQIQWDTDANFGSPSDRRVPGGDSPVTIALPDDDTRRYFRWRTVRGDCSTPGDWSATVSAKPQQIPSDLPACPDVGFDKPPVEFTASEDRAAGTGTLTGDVVGDGTYTIDIIRVEKDDTETTVQTTTGVTDGGASDPVTYTESLQEKTNLLLYAKVTDEAESEVVQVTDLFSFDPDAIPDFQSIDISVRDDGTVEWDVLGDTDTNSGELAFDFDGDSTTDETATFSGISGSGTTTGTIASGDSGTVTVTLYAGAGQTGNSRSKSVPISRTSASDVQVLRADITESSDTTNATTLSVDALGTDKAVGPVEVRVESVVIGSGGGWTVEQNWTSTLPTGVTVSKNTFAGTIVRAFVRDGGDNDKQGAPAFHTVWGTGALVDDGYLDGSGRPDQIRDGTNTRDIPGGDVHDFSAGSWLNKHGDNLPFKSGATITTAQKTGVAGQVWTNIQNGQIQTTDLDLNSCSGVAIGVSQDGTSFGSNGSNFTVNNGGESISVPATTIDGLTCNTTYYVYYDHTTTSVKATTSKATAQDWDHMLLGSILTTDDRTDGGGTTCGGCGGGGGSDETTKEIV